LQQQAKDFVKTGRLNVFFISPPAKYIISSKIMLTPLSIQQKTSLLKKNPRQLQWPGINKYKK